MAIEIYTCAICHEDSDFMAFSIPKGNSTTYLCSSVCVTILRRLEICVRSYIHSLKERNIQQIRHEKQVCPSPHPQAILNTLLERELKFDMLPASVLWKPYKKST